MAGLMHVGDISYSEIALMKKKDYMSFLERKMEELSKSEKYSKYKVVREKQFFRFFIYPPTVNGIEYIENEQQRQGRVELLNNYRELYNKALIQQDTNPNMQLNQERWVDADSVEEILGITRRTLYNLMDDENSELNIESRKKKLLVERSSLIKYLNNRHVVATNLGFEKMYKTYKTLSRSTKAELQEINKAKVLEIIESKEYEKLWDKYFKEIPEERRVYQEREKKDIEGYQIFTPTDKDVYFDIYNPNIQISPQYINEVPKMYTVNYISAILDMTPRSILRYCEYGNISYYKVGGRYMFSVEDFTRGQDKIEKRTKQPKSNVGRKRKIEIILSDSDLFEGKFFSHFDNQNLNQMKEIHQQLIELREQEDATQKSLRIIKNENITSDSSNRAKDSLIEAKNQLKDIKAKINMLEKTMSGLRREFFNEIIKDKEDENKVIIDKIFSIRKSIDIIKKAGQNLKKETGGIDLEWNAAPLKFLEESLVNEKEKLINSFLE